VITFTDRHTSLSGVLQNQSGTPASEYFVVAFSTDRATWRPDARRTKSVRPASDGRYEFRDLPPGEYFLAALTDVEPTDLADPKFLEQLVPAALTLTLGAGEQKTHDITIAR
jgi:hypothetical protein